MKSQPRYRILHQLMIAKTEETRSTRLERFASGLNRETLDQTRVLLRRQLND
ncbi:hypothetical protein GT020_10595 [Glutamicibacter soli]|uniref:Uncharacterized protein n=1 Tax=Glutamicibacter soli TaxID=453836 RepID=A0A6L9G5P0_9MICC|nr:hypothetical protein [Glutamicibacter soli]